jgi:hypothetical protein
MALVNLDRPLQVLGASAVSGGGGVTSLQDLSNLFGNFLYVDEETDLALVSGEREIPAGYTIEFVDNAITGLAPLFTAPLRIQDGANCVIQAPLTLNAIVYVGTGRFIRCNDIGFYIQNNIIIVTPFGDYIELFSTNTTPEFDTAFSIDNFAFFGLSPGEFSNLDVVNANSWNVLDWTGGLLIDNCRRITMTEFISTNPSVAGVGPLARIRGEKTEGITFNNSDAALSSVQNYLDISPDISDEARITIRSINFSDQFGADFFTVGSQGSITAYADNSSTGTITAMADNGAGGTTITHTGTNPGNGRKVTQSGTTDYNGTFTIFNASAGQYDIDTPFTTNEATGTWDFESVTITTSAAHGLSDGEAVLINKSTNYNFGRVIFNASGSVFSIDDVPFNGDDAAGQWDSGSLKQNAPGMVCEGNGDQPDTSQLLALDVTTLETLTGTATGTGALITTWSVNVDNQYTLNPPGQVLGTVRYDGRDIRAGVTLSCAYVANSGNPGAPISFRLFRDSGGGFVQVNSDIPGVLTNQEDSVTWTLETPLIKGDLLQVRVYDVANNSIDIVSASLLSKADGQGI